MDVWLLREPRLHLRFGVCGEVVQDNVIVLPGVRFHGQEGQEFLPYRFNLHSLRTFPVVPFRIYSGVRFSVAAKVTGRTGWVRSSV